MCRLPGGAGNQLRIHQECKEGDCIRQKHRFQEGYGPHQRQDLLCKGSRLQDGKRREGLWSVQQREESKAIVAENFRLKKMKK